jgi:hypothetical protein
MLIVNQNGPTLERAYLCLTSSHPNKLQSRQALRLCVRSVQIILNIRYGGILLAFMLHGLLEIGLFLGGESCPTFAGAGPVPNVLAL